MFSGDTKDKALWLVILLPGFVTIGIARLTSTLPGISDFQLGILYFVVSIVNALAALSIAHTFLLVNGCDLELEPLAACEFMLHSIERGEFRFGQILEWLTKHIRCQ